jgi:thiamine-phosphate pyrophosphorylase
MNLIVITPDGTSQDETTIVNQLFENGLQRLHLRKPLFTTEEYRNYIAEVREEFYGRIVLCNSFELWNEFDLGGIHLNSALRNDKGVWETVKDIMAAKISASFHSWQEIEENDFHYGYVFISPVFDSISKEGYKAGVDLHVLVETKLKLILQNKYCPGIIGLGGVGVQQIEVLAANGFDGAAMLGAIWQANDPVQKFREALNAITALKGG